MGASGLGCGLDGNCEVWCCYGCCTGCCWAFVVVVGCWLFDCVLFGLLLGWLFGCYDCDDGFVLRCGFCGNFASAGYFLCAYVTLVYSAVRGLTYCLWLGLIASFAVVWFVGLLVLDASVCSLGKVVL